MLAAWRGGSSGPVALLLLAAAVVADAGCSRSEPPGGRGAGLAASPAVVAPGRPATPVRAPREVPPAPPAPPAAPASAAASAPAGDPESPPTSMPDVFAAPPTPGSVISDGEGRRFPVNQALVTVATGTTREEVDRIAATVGGRVVGQILSARLYQVQVPTKTADELEVTMGRLRKEPKVKGVTYNLMRRPPPK